MSLSSLSYKIYNTLYFEQQVRRFTLREGVVQLIIFKIKVKNIFLYLTKEFVATSLKISYQVRKPAPLQCLWVKIVSFDLAGSQPHSTKIQFPGTLSILKNPSHRACTRKVTGGPSTNLVLRLLCHCSFLVYLL